ncbi:MAG: hypothetical protein K6T65_10315 [Peptococcaceae bacterium]|nr:hypothetical protein [Peptococcaceae bacterium]
MYKRVTVVTAALAVFLAGSYAEAKFNITPVVTAAFKTGQMLAGDFYVRVLARFGAGVDTTAALFAAGGFLALLSFRYLARYRRF